MTRSSKHAQLQRWGVVLFCWMTFVVALSSPAAAQGRFLYALENQVSVVHIDNYSSRSNAHVADLVIKADRSTKDAQMFLRPSPVKGLFGHQDRIFVNNNYLAWFDVEQGGGRLAGVWTLNPSTGSFKHLRTVAPGVQWAHNELIPGSASPYQQEWHWDTFASAIGHTIGFQVSPTEVIVSDHESGYTAPNGNWHAIYDGAPVDGGIAYAVGTRMAISVPGAPTKPVDVSDGNDANGIQNHIDSELGYVCKETEIKIVWRFKPATAPVAPFNTFYHAWFNYSFNDAVDPFCPQTPDWPDQVWGEPSFYQSNIPSVRADNQVSTGPLVIVPLERGTPCAYPTGIAQRFANNPPNGAWIRWGEQSALSAGTPRWTLTHIVESTYGTPLNLSHLLFLNEIADGVWGGGGGLYNQGSAFAQFFPGIWYATSYTLSSQ